MSFLFFLYLCNVIIYIMKKTCTQTLYRQEWKGKILQTAMEEFTQKGVRAVKMDDIATRLSISKRTLYEIYSNKEDLLLEGVRLYHKESAAYMYFFSIQPEHNVMDISIEFYQKKMGDLARTNPVFYSDIHKYETVTAFLEEEHERNEEEACRFFERGIHEGFFRPDFDYGIISRIGNVAMKYVMETKMYQEYDMQYIFRNIVFTLIRGFCTQKGIEIIDKRLSA